jgi:hypothetical protein
VKDEENAEKDENEDEDEEEMTQCGDDTRCT